MDLMISKPSGQPFATRNGTILTGSWGGCNELLLHECPKKMSDVIGEQTAPSEEQDVSLLHLKWNSEMFNNDATRELISQSASIFTAFNRVKGSESRSSHVLEASRKYRSVVQACSERISESDLQTSFKQIGMMWHLCEILFLDLHPPGMLVNELLRWVQWHYPENNTRAEQVFRAENPAQHPLFWTTITGFLMRGDMENAAILLSTCTGVGDKEYVSVLLEIIRKMPRYTAGQLSHEFDMRWQAWNEECRQVWGTGYFSDHPKFNTILSILCGDESTIVSARSEEMTWFNIIPAVILYTDPFLKERDLASIARKYLHSFTSSEDAETAVDRLLMSAFNLELMDVIKQGCLLTDNWWLVSHFVDLLFGSKQLQQHQIQEEEKLREFLLLDYADGLMSHSSLWSVAIDYYDACSRLGLERLQLSLARVTLDSEKKAIAVLDIAEKRSLKTLYRSLCRTMAQKWLSRSKLSTALVWGIRGGDSQVCSLVADLILRSYVTSKSFAESDVLNSLGANMFISERLTFLAKYFEFHQLNEAGEQKAAADLLVSLISSNVSPHFFMSTLLMDSLPFLKSEKILFDADQTCQIMAVFQDALELDVDEKDAVASLNMNELKEQESKLRLHLGRSLAASLVT